ncbi:hypothetical protein, partial [Paractinoplanes toevensis]|uniref:hypothetical protein n=1 Tax=Paractinoplanes toevensis TaxID=571911 RepID=UPI001BB3FD9F
LSYAALRSTLAIVGLAMFDSTGLAARRRTADPLNAPPTCDDDSGTDQTLKCHGADLPDEHRSDITDESGSPITIAGPEPGGPRAVESDAKAGQNPQAVERHQA